MSFNQPDVVQWTTWEKNDPQRDTVEIFDEDGRLPVYKREKKKNYGRWILMDSVEETRRYRSRKSTLDCELQVRKASS